MIEIIRFKGKKYPKWQSEGFAAKFIFPFAQIACKGFGYDVGFCKPEWKLPGAAGIDLDVICDQDTNIIHRSPGTSATNLPGYVELKLDYIFSSHCLEHLNDWVDVLIYWRENLVVGGVLFLYLPHPHQQYWHPWNNRKHINYLSPDVMKGYFKAGGWTNIFISHRDLNDSFACVAEKI